MASVTQYKIPVEAYPRYKYAKRIVSRHNKKCQKMFKVCGLIDDKELPVFEDVLLYVHSNPRRGKDILSVDQILFKKVDNVTVTKMTPKQYEEETRRSDLPPGVPVVDVMLYSETVPEKTCGRFQFRISEDYVGEKVSAVKAQAQDSEVTVTYMCVTKETEFATDLCNLLERFVFTTLKERVRVLQSLLGADCLDFEQSDECLKAKLEPYCKRLLQNYQQINICLAYRELIDVLPQMVKRQISVIENSIEKLSTKLTNLPTTDDIQNEADANISYDMTRLRRHRDIVCSPNVWQKLKDLEGEAHAMFLRSNVPKADWPDSSVYRETVEEEVPKKLFERVPAVAGCGFRYNTFQVFVDQTSTCPQNEMEKSIVRVLTQHNIREFALFKGKRTIRPLSSFSVGNTVDQNFGRSGSLGGFAVSTHQNDDLYLLTAKHVTDPERGSVVFVTSDLGERKHVASLLAPVNIVASTMDIAVSKVHDEFKDEFERQFKDSKGIPNNSQLLQEGTFGAVSGLDVHIWGAKSKPGRGKVASLNWYNKTADNGMEKLIVIEDFSPSDEEIDDDEASGPTTSSNVKTFARGGDSGAVVCADDPDEKHVTVLSMLMGEQYPRDGPTKYMTFSLSAGLRQLGLDQDDNFEIC